MTADYLGAVLDRKAEAERAARTPAVPPVPETALGVREIPRSCSCTWKPSYSTLPATWTLTRADPSCRLHGTRKDEAA